ncbi:hypothetical protein TrCOL_g6484 [Triparma columacea]|uniref:Uncharacterized protein n=1 Tax=Triparma columacea TaxID=722753 RepID=A0A9W7G1F3_9STRA|nr:hypothetical protein TrCOL_g6484 [Triparma columacea]
MEDSISNENIAPKRKAASELCADEEQEVKKICAISRVVTDHTQSSGGKETEVGQEKSEETAKASEDTAKGRPSTPKTPEGVLDVPMFLGLEDGARLAILWDLDGEGEGEKIRKWWGGTLLPYDGRTHAMTDDETGDNATCALRVIDYDEAPELGYAERTLSEVAFLGDHLVYDLSEDNTTCYKREGESWEPSDVDLEEEPAEVLGAVVCDGDVYSGDMEKLVDGIFLSVLKKVFPMYSSSTAYQQRLVAETYVKSKEKVLEVMKVKLSGVTNITREHIQEIMEEVGAAIQATKAGSGEGVGGGGVAGAGGGGGSGF